MLGLPCNEMYLQRDHVSQTLSLSCFKFFPPSGLDEDCEPLGDLTDTNRTSCAFYPCMKATGRESKDEELIDIRIYYCGHDADFNSVCENEDFVGLLLTWKFQSKIIKQGRLPI